MEFSEALDHLKKGAKMKRAGWPDNVFIFYVPGSTFSVNRLPLSTVFPLGHEATYAPHIDVCIGSNVSVWDAQTMDILGTDWEFKTV